LREGAAAQKSRDGVIKKLLMPMETERKSQTEVRKIRLL